MNFDDIICNKADFYERATHYKDQVCNDDSTSEEQIWAHKHGRDMAIAEMLNEVHFMLRELLKSSNS